MTDAQYEICRIVTKYRQIRGTLFRSDEVTTQIIAERITSNGISVIAQSQEFTLSTKTRLKKEDDYYASLDQAEKRIIAEILADAWEPFAFDNKVGHLWFKRRAKNQEIAPEPVTDDFLLKYLIALRDLGILTQEEFDTKLPTVLKRL